MHLRGPIGCPLLLSACTRSTARTLLAMIAMACAAHLATAQSPATPPPSLAPVPSAPVLAPSSNPQQPTDALTPAQQAAQRRAKADQQLKLEEKQRILGLVPNFNTIDMQTAVPLSPKQKFQLMYKSSVDPAIFVIAALNGAIGQAEDDFQGYGQGWGP